MQRLVDRVGTKTTVPEKRCRRLRPVPKTNSNPTLEPLFTDADGQNGRWFIRWCSSIWRHGLRVLGPMFRTVIPSHVDQDFRNYLQCGILVHGFARAYCADCGHDFLVAFSCKGRGFCPSCNTRRMAETAAHLVDQVFPRVPVRQWVMAFPKRLRYFLHHDADLVNRVLGIFLAIVENALKSCSPGAPSNARIGAVTFVHRFGSALNANLHFHCCIIDGVFSVENEQVRFDEAVLTDEAMVKVQAQVRERVLRLFKRRGLLAPETVNDMREWRHGGGFSLNADVTVPAWDRTGLERLLRYCARPIFASERLRWIEQNQRLIYQLPKPRPDGRTVLSLTPLEFLDKLTVLTVDVKVVVA